jgi:hypothetical protein
MDYSQYIRLKQEAANVYIARMKPVDSSFLTMQKQQKSAHAGSIKANPPANSFIVDKGACPIDHSFTMGYIPTNSLSQQEDHATRAAGCVLCKAPDYSIISPGVTLKNCNEVSTILTSFNNNKPAPGQWKCHGYGVAKFFPVAQCSTINKYPYPSG